MDAKARTVAEELADEMLCMGSPLRENMVTKLLAYRADAVAQAVKEVRLSAEKYYDQMARDFVTDALAEQAKEIARLREFIQMSAHWRWKQAALRTEQAEEIAQLRADIAENERRIGHREEKIARPREGARG